MDRVWRDDISDCHCLHVLEVDKLIPLYVASLQLTTLLIQLILGENKGMANVLAQKFQDKNKVFRLYGSLNIKYLRKL